MKETQVGMEGSIGEDGNLSVMSNKLTLSVTVRDEGETLFDFKDSTFGMVGQPPEFYIIAYLPEGADKGLLKIRGVGLENHTNYRIGTGEGDVYVDLEIQGITDYTTDPEGTFNVLELSEAPDGKTYLIGSFYFEMYGVPDRPKTIIVRCNQFQLELSN